MTKPILSGGWATFCLAAMLIACLSGCGDGRPQTYTVTGSVAYPDGKPVRSGTVELRSEQLGINARGRIDHSGNFQLGTFEAADGAVAGAHQVIVTQVSAPSDARRAPNDAIHAGLVVSMVAHKHASYETSGLAAQIKPADGNQLRLVVERRDETPH